MAEKQVAMRSDLLVFGIDLKAAAVLNAALL